MSFGELLKKYKDRDRYTYQQLADLLNVGRQTVVHWCYDNAKPRDEKNILKLAKIFNLSVNETNKLLLAAGHRTLENLRQQAEMLPANQGDELLHLLQFWEQEVTLSEMNDTRKGPNHSISSIFSGLNRRYQLRNLHIPGATFVLAGFVFVVVILFALFVLDIRSLNLDPIQSNNGKVPCKFYQDQPNCGMSLIRAGSFEMGSHTDVGRAECQKFAPNAGCQRSWFENEAPIHPVTLDDFYIDLYEVTNAQYAECEANGPCTPPSDTGSVTRKSYYGNPEYDDYPVIWVTWEQAKTYCEWREARLPTEAEWEKAARGIEGRLYPWGNSLDGNRANFCDTNCPFDHRSQNYDDGQTDTAAVGSYPNGVSPYSVYDMAGNVWEWVADWYDANYYSTSPAENPLGPAGGTSRVLRGGAWNVDGGSVRATRRFEGGPATHYYDVGFRCARSP
jgi:formylglycine-generating enzyme required for sulfatase activity